MPDKFQAKSEDLLDTSDDTKIRVDVTSPRIRRTGTTKTLKSPQ
jgi:hypothetical protein